jgi:hypothetical protein
VKRGERHQLFGLGLDVLGGFARRPVDRLTIFNRGFGLAGRNFGGAGGLEEPVFFRRQGGAELVGFRQSWGSLSGLLTTERRATPRRANPEAFRKF